MQHRETFRASDLIWLHAYGFAQNVETSALLTIVLPSAILDLQRGGHTAELAKLATLGAVVAILLPPFAGQFSDRLVRRGQRRGTLLRSAALANVVGLLVMVLARNIGQLTLGFLLAMLAQSVSNAAYQAFWSEAVLPEQRGQLAGYRGVANLLGTICGLALAGLLGPQSVLELMVVVIPIGAACTLGVGESPHLPPGRNRVRVRSRRDFALTFAARMLVMLGMNLLMTFILYFFKNVQHAPSPSAGTAAVGVLALAGAVASSILVSSWSDRTKRATLVSVAALPMAGAALGFAFLDQSSWIFLFGVLFGLGYGAFISTDWALAIDTLPGQDNLARDLGIWDIASALPSALAPAIGGWLLLRELAFGLGYAVGYRWLFGLAGVCFLISAAVVYQVGRPPKPRALKLLIAAGLWVYLKLSYHIELEGPLPRPSGRPALVIANHQHDLEGTVLPAWLGLAGLGGPGVQFVASERIFEPGFLATRSPAWMRPPIARVGLRGLFGLMGVWPIENEPLAPSLISQAGRLLEWAGDAPLGDVLVPSALERLGLPADLRLSQLTAARWLRAARQNVTLVDFREGARRQLLEDTLPRISKQLAAIEAAFAGGALLFLTPEGRYSVDGRMHRLRLALDRLLPAAQELWVVHLAYDPLARRRLALYGYFEHLEPVPDRSELELRLRAGRPVTLSQLLCSWLVGCGGPFTAEQAWQGLQAALSALPQAAVRMGDARNPSRRRLDRALVRLCRDGLLERVGESFVLRAAERHPGPRYPGSGDPVRYQAEMLTETCQALRATRMAA